MQTILCHWRRYSVCIPLFGVLLLTILIALAAVSPEAVWPVEGKKHSSKGNLTVDYSHADEGYILAKGSKGKNRLKLRITCGDETLTYDINRNGEYEVFPLTGGSGKYKCVLYRNTSGKKYSQDGSVTVKAKMKREDAAFLCPNQYVSYTKNTSAVITASEICEGLSSDSEKLETIRSYVTHNFVYDYIQALTVSAGDLPNIDRCWEKRMGICQDLSAVTVCMLRTQGIPAKLMIGYADQNYHAWVAAYIGGEEIQFDPTADMKAIAKPVQYTLERFY